jgi:hypothetical protein
MEGPMRIYNKLLNALFLKQNYISNNPPRESSTFEKQKYVFNLTSKAVFLGSRYVGQGVLTDSTLFVTQYRPISADKFIITHLN